MGLDEVHRLRRTVKVQLWKAESFSSNFLNTSLCYPKIRIEDQKGITCFWTKIVLYKAEQKRTSLALYGSLIQCLDRLDCWRKTNFFVCAWWEQLKCRLAFQIYSLCNCMHTIQLQDPTKVLSAIEWVVILGIGYLSKADEHMISMWFQISIFFFPFQILSSLQ